MHLYKIVYDKLVDRIERIKNDENFREDFNVYKIFSHLRDALQSIISNETEKYEKKLHVEIIIKNNYIKNNKRGELVNYRSYYQMNIFIEREYINDINTINDLNKINKYLLHTISRTFVHEFTHFIQDEREQTKDEKNIHKLNLNPTEYKELKRTIQNPSSFRAQDYYNGSGEYLGQNAEIEAHATNVANDLLRSTEGDVNRALKKLNLYFKNPFSIPETMHSLYAYRFNMRKNPLFPQVWKRFCKKIYQHLNTAKS